MTPQNKDQIILCIIVFYTYSDHNFTDLNLHIARCSISHFHILHAPSRPVKIKDDVRRARESGWRSDGPPACYTHRQAALLRPIVWPIGPLSKHMFRFHKFPLYLSWVFVHVWQQSTYALYKIYTFYQRLNLGGRKGAIVCTMLTGRTMGQSAQSPWPVVWHVGPSSFSQTRPGWFYT